MLREKSWIVKKLSKKAWGIGRLMKKYRAKDAEVDY